MKRNVASQVIGAQMITAADGTAFTGTVSVVVTKDNGTQTAGGGTVAHKGNGYHSYLPTQAETDAGHIAFTFTGTGAMPVTVQVYTVDEIAAVMKAIALTEGYAADGAAPTLEQILFMLWSRISETSLAGSTLTAKKLDGSTTAMTFNLTVDGADVTAITRAT